MIGQAPPVPSTPIPAACVRCNTPLSSDLSFCPRCGLKAGKKPKAKPTANRDETLNPLSAKEIELVLDAASRYDGAQGRMHDIVRWFLRTGCHVSILSDPAKFRLRLDQGAFDGQLALFPHWSRTKKDGSDALCGGFPLEQGDESWAPGFVTWVKDVRWTTRYYQDQIAELGRSAGLERPLSPMTFRHTFAVYFLLVTRDPWRLCQVLNITLKTAFNYLRLVPAESDRVFFKGFLPKPGASERSLFCPLCRKQFGTGDWISVTYHAECNDRILGWSAKRLGTVEPQEVTA